MTKLTSQILQLAAELPEAALIHAKALLHLGNRAALDQALSRLARRGELLRVSRGVYVRPIKTRFGVRAPSPNRLVEQIAKLRGEEVAPNGAAAANALGLTTQVPTREQYVTSGRELRLKVGQQIIEVKHAPAWQFARKGRPGQVIRALAWLGRQQAPTAMPILKRRLSKHELREISSAQPILPSWMAAAISETLAAHV